MQLFYTFYSVKHNYMSKYRFDIDIVELYQVLSNNY